MRQAVYLRQCVDGGEEWGTAAGAVMQRYLSRICCQMLLRLGAVSCYLAALQLRDLRAGAELVKFRQAKLSCLGPVAAAAQPSITINMLETNERQPLHMNHWLFHY